VGSVRLDEWFLTAGERGNPGTTIDSRHPGGRAWTAGNDVRPLVHGAVYFAELLGRVRAMQAGDLLMFTDWRGDPDERLDGPGTEVARVLCEAVARGVIVKGLIWRSHLDRFQFSATENRRLDESIVAAGGECLLDMRVRPGGSHHMKLIVLRHPSRPEEDVAFIGGVDLCHSRRDDAAHHGDPQRQPMAAVYGATPPWHDVQAMIRGPAVGDAEAVFRERWQDPQPLTRNPVHRLHDFLRRDDTRPDPLPPQLPDPQPRGSHAVQLLRTYPYRWSGYTFAPRGERSIARAYLKALPRARSLIYLEDQYLWNRGVVRSFADVLAAQPELRLIAVIPRFPDQDGRLSLQPNLIGRLEALDMLRQAGGGRVGVYGIENEAGTPIYVHAKVCVVDDTWAIVGSDNFNRRSWTHDSELSCAVIDDTGDPREPRDPGGFGHGARVCARDLRLALSREHLGRAPGGAGGEEGAGGTGGGPAEAVKAVDLLDPKAVFEAFAESAKNLDAWHRGGRQGPRPPGQLRTYQVPQLSRWTRTWAALPYRLIYDPDGRPRRMRRAGQF
jgi:phosphatidylserine/phosphatidylglycerophosphate/cardiolipin synthase-like enzyme